MLYWINVAASALAVFAVAYFDLLGALPQEALRNAAGVVAQISATLAGFLLAVLSILATIVNTKLVRNMQKTGHYQLLLRRLFINAALFVAAMISGMIAVFTSAMILPVFALMFFSFAGLMFLADVAFKLWMVLSHLHPVVDAQS